jgi:hypothetical protein
VADGAAVDTDVLLKTSAYRLAAELVSTVNVHGTPGALGLAHLIAGRQILRVRGLRDPDGARAALEALLATLEKLEPNEAEILMSAKLAGIAQIQGLPLDSGEAQLAAVVLSRRLPLMLTGDKRAIGALARLLDDEETRSGMVGRLACFEQAVAAICRRIGAEVVRERVCAEPDVDGAMRLACSCDRPDWNPSQLHEACGSFIGAVKADVGDLLAEDSALA